MMEKPKGTYTQQPHEHTQQCSNEHITVISPFLTNKEMCEVLKICRKTLYSRVKSGQIKEVRVGGCIRYPIKENNLEKYLM